MKKFNKIYFLALLVSSLVSCEREVEQELSSEVEYPILFSVEEVEQTRVSYSEQSDGTISAAFDVGDNIGLYAYFNNFYYYYSDYGCFAESVLLSNQGSYVDSNNNLIYSTLRSWTFSTLYGTAPYTFDCIGYYPFREGYNPDYVNMVHDSDGAAMFEYYYVNRESVTEQGETEEQDETVELITVNSQIDFMLAHTSYADYNYTTEEFREAMLELSSIPLTFTRCLASLNLQVTKPDDYPTEIAVTELTFYFYANEKFVCYLNSDTTEWSDMSSELLTYTVTLDAADATDMAADDYDATNYDVPILEETGWESTPEEGSSNETANLLATKNMVFFPPQTEIWKIVFTINDGGTEKSYTWHPHTATIEANTHYTLSLELDPDRAN